MRRGTKRIASTATARTFSTSSSSSSVRAVKNSSVVVRSNAPVYGYGARSFASAAVKSSKKYKGLLKVSPVLVGVVVGVAGSATVLLAAEKTNWDQVRKEIKGVIDSNPKYDDGSYAPVLIRLAWHASGTYCRQTKSGGSNGALMRFKEGNYGANAGLKIARDLLEPIKKKHPEISYADLWTLAGAVAVEHMGGPHIPWRSGRLDHSDDSKGTPDGRLPDASKDRSHIREVFYRMGFDDRETVALLGAHAVGRCHSDRSGYDGPWTSSPVTFTNEFYTQLKEAKWTARSWKGPKQYEDETKSMMMLPTDMELLNDPELKVWVEKYAGDEELFFKDFAGAFSKLLELGVEYPKESLESLPSKREVHQQHQQYLQTHEVKHTDEKVTEGWSVWIGGLFGGGSSEKDEKKGRN